MFGRLPVWFVEGLGVEVSGGGGAEGVTGAALSAAIAEGHAFVPDVDEGLFSGKGASAYGLDEHVFYGEAGLFVAHLRARAPERFATFLRALEGGATLDAAYEAANGHPLDVAWREFVAQQSALPERE